MSRDALRCEDSERKRESAVSSLWYAGRLLVVPQDVATRFAVEVVNALTENKP